MYDLVRDIKLNKYPDNETIPIFNVIFGDRPSNRIIDFLFQHNKFDYPINEIMKATRTKSRSSIYKEIINLEEKNIIHQTRIIGKRRFYYFAENKLTEDLIRLGKFTLEKNIDSYREAGYTNEQLSKLIDRKN